MLAVTAFLVLTTLLLVCAGFTIGLTYAPCYSSYCVEQFFPYEARIHVAFYYALLASIGVTLGLRASSDTARRISRTYVWNKPIPILGKRLSVGGLFVTLYIVGLTHATMGYWHGPAYSFWDDRGAMVDWTSHMAQVAYTTITGHWCDITIGLVIIPVGRNSLIGNLFELHVSTLLCAHKLLAYLLLVYVIVHAGFYISFIPSWAALPEGSAAKEYFNVDNPAFTNDNSDLWNYACLATGAVGLILILVIVITALPKLRRINYNTFYYCHVICSILLIIVTCFHASTDFYCLLPGLLLWVADWVWRGFHGLKTKVEGTLENAGNDWYRINLPVSVYSGRSVDGEKAVENPLQTYYISFPSISRIQGHAFTAAATSTLERGPYFLFQRSMGKKAKKLNKEWTWKLAAQVPGDSQSKSLDVRIEGPYTPAVPEMYRASHVICIAGGTGITGALCVVDWWLRHRAGERGTSLRLEWTVRERRTADLPEITALKQRIESTPNASFQINVTSESGRKDPARILEEASTSTMSHAVQEDKSQKSGETVPSQGPAWVYCSGPEGLLASTEAACINLEKKLRREQDSTIWTGLDFYVARWSL